jgi:hypothetical protein
MSGIKAPKTEGAGARDAESMKLASGIPSGHCVGSACDDTRRGANAIRDDIYKYGFCMERDQNTRADIRGQLR